MRVKITNHIIMLIIATILEIVFAGIGNLFESVLAIISIAITYIIITRVYKLVGFQLTTSINFFRLFLYIMYLTKEIIMANINVAKVILGKNKLRSEIIIIKNPGLQSLFTEYIFANSITLTPGTLVIGYDPKELLVSCLDENSKQGLLSDSMSKQIKKIEV